MKILLIPILSAVFILTTGNPFINIQKPSTVSNPELSTEKISNKSGVPLQVGNEFGRMRSVEFKNQEYCRVELKDFEFDARFSVVSATVYFSGANFKAVEKGVITSNSLKPVKSFMDRCIPGTIVVFDYVKVKGPDNLVRIIPGVSLQLF